jgi:hypothetical protein
MSGNLVFGSNVNPGAPGGYVDVIAPPTYVNGVPTDIIGVCGTASWGPLNSATLLGSPAEVISSFGGITAAALTDAHDLCTDLIIAFTQAQSQATLAAYGVRVSDGTDVAASHTMSDTEGSPAVGGTFTALYSGTLGNQISISVSQGNLSTLVNVTITGFAGSQPEVYPGLPNTSAFWVAFESATKNGLPNVRGPSQLGTFTHSGSPSAGPALVTTTLTSGTDGRSSVTTAQLIGTNASAPVTGLYTLATVKPLAGEVWCAGLTDTAGAANFLAACAAIPAHGQFSAPAGAASNTSTMISTLQATGVASPFVSYTGNWKYWYDPVNGILRLVPPYAFQGGTIGTLQPEVSPLNEPVFGVVGSERNNPNGTPQPYTNVEIAALQQAGFLIVDNPIPAGPTWGFITGTNTATNPAQSPVEYTRLTIFLGLSLLGVSGQFVGMNQSIRPNDPYRALVNHVLNEFGQGLVDANRVDAQSTTCKLAQTGSPQDGINTPATISQHYSYARVNYRYLSSVWYFVLSMQGGTTVITTGSAAGPSQPGS